MEFWKADEAVKRANGKTKEKTGTHPELYKHPPTVGTARWQRLVKRVKKQILKQEEEAAANQSDEPTKPSTNESKITPQKSPQVTPTKTQQSIKTVQTYLEPDTCDVEEENFDEGRWSLYILETFFKAGEPDSLSFIGCALNVDTRLDQHNTRNKFQDFKNLPGNIIFQINFNKFGDLPNLPGGLFTSYHGPFKLIFSMSGYAGLSHEHCEATLKEMTGTKREFKGTSGRLKAILYMVSKSDEFWDKKEQQFKIGDFKYVAKIAKQYSHLISDDLKKQKNFKFTILDKKYEIITEEIKTRVARQNVIMEERIQRAELKKKLKKCTTEEERDDMKQSYNGFIGKQAWNYFPSTRSNRKAWDLIKHKYPDTEWTGMDKPIRQRKSAKKGDPGEEKEQALQEEAAQEQDPPEEEEQPTVEEVVQQQEEEAAPVVRGKQTLMQKNFPNTNPPPIAVEPAVKKTPKKKSAKKQLRLTPEDEVIASPKVESKKNSKQPSQNIPSQKIPSQIGDIKTDAKRCSQMQDDAMQQDSYKKKQMESLNTCIVYKVQIAREVKKIQDEIKAGEKAKKEAELAKRIEDRKANRPKKMTGKRKKPEPTKEDEKPKEVATC